MAMNPYYNNKTFFFIPFSYNGFENVLFSLKSDKIKQLCAGIILVLYLLKN